MIDLHITDNEGCVTISWRDEMAIEILDEELDAVIDRLQEIRQERADYEQLQQEIKQLNVFNG